MTTIAEHWIDGEWVGSDTVSGVIQSRYWRCLGRWSNGGIPRRARRSLPPGGHSTPLPGLGRGLRHKALERDGGRASKPTPRSWDLITKENGKKLAEGMFEGGSPASPSSTTPATALTDTGTSAEVAPEWLTTYGEPAGVVGMIVPWNSPVVLLIRSLAPALAAGNTVAVKMPGRPPSSPISVSQIVAEFESLAARGRQHLHRVGQHGAPSRGLPDVDVISYTGSSPVGRIIVADGAPTLKRMNLELGGKTPMVVFDDADLDGRAAARGRGHDLRGPVLHDRVADLVQRGVADEVRTASRRVLENVRVGDGMEPDTDMGPLIDKSNVARVNGVVEAALAYAKPIVRGGPATTPPSRPGRSTGRRCWRSRTSPPTSSKRRFRAGRDVRGVRHRSRRHLGGQRNRNGSRRRGLHQQPQHQPSRQPRHQGRNGLDQHVGGDQRRVRRGWLQAERGRAPSRPARDHRVPGGQDRRALNPLLRSPYPSTTRAGRTEYERTMTCRKPDRCRRPVVAEPARPRRRQQRGRPDATYVSLNTEDPELSKIMPWAGTSHGPQAFLDNLGAMFTRWENQAFNVTAMFASEENVAVFGDFRYKSHSLGNGGFPVLDPREGGLRSGDLPPVPRGHLRHGVELPQGRLLGRSKPNLTRPPSRSEEREVCPSSGWTPAFAAKGHTVLPTEVNLVARRSSPWSASILCSIS